MFVYLLRNNLIKPLELLNEFIKFISEYFIMYLLLWDRALQSNFCSIFMPGIINDTQYLCWYPWCTKVISTIFMSGLSYTIFISSIHDTLYNYAWYPWYTIYISCIYDTQNICLVSMIQNVYICYPWYTVLRFGIHDAHASLMSDIDDMQYLCLVSLIRNIYSNRSRLWFYVL